MIPEYKNFGKKAFQLFLIKWLETPMGFLILAVTASLMGRTRYIPAEYHKIVSLVAIVSLVVAILSAIISVAVSRFVFNQQEFCMAEDAFKHRKGIFRQKEIAIPYRQIQNVEIERTLHQRMFGVSRLIISTAGEDNELTVEQEGKAILNDIDKDIAISLQNELLNKADVQRVVSVGGFTPI